jgi:hypothetical protein
MPGDKTIRTFAPPLLTALLEAEKAKGAPLTEPEVLAIRDRAPVTLFSEAEAAQAEKERGYADIDADNCWHEWQHVRLQFLDAQ